MGSGPPPTGGGRIISRDWLDRVIELLEKLLAELKKLRDEG